jgi:hypothetical protein
VWLKLPVLFDLFTLVLLVGGCLLLWLNLCARREDASPTIIDDPEGEESMGPMAQLSVAKKASDLCAEGAGLLSTPHAQQSDAHADAMSTEQNHYASSVSAAIVKSKKQNASV